MKKTYSINSTKGFTMFEMMLVIGIIGVIMAGILAGQDLMTSSKRNNVIAEINKYVSAYNNFKTQYNEVPGDMSNATTVLGAAHNGDGSGNVDTTDEAYYAWEHMKMADLVDGNYDGVQYGYGSAANLTKVPGSAVDGGYYKIYASPYTGNGWYLAHYNIYKRGGNWIGLGSVNGNSGFDYPGGVFNGENASIIDSKMDDGKPATGTFFVTKGVSAAASAFQDGCINKNPGTWDLAAQNLHDVFDYEVEYKKTSKLVACRPMYWLD